MYVVKPRTKPHKPLSTDAARALERLRDLSGDLGPRAARHGRAQLRARLDRLRQRSFLIAQVSVAAATAWWIAHEALDHPQPFFAPVAAIVALGVSYNARLRRVFEVTAGVAVGVGVGDLFVSIAGTGVWQITLVVMLSMAVAVLLDAGALIVTQAGVQSVIVTTLLPAPGAGLSRWLDAVVGGGVALLAAVVAPATPLRRPRQQAARVLHELALLLHEAARSAVDGDVERAARTLERARDTESGLDDLRQAASEGLDIIRLSPLRRGHRDSVQAVADLAEPLDRAIRNGRVLIRRVTAAANRDEPVPAAYAELVDRLGTIVERMAADLGQRTLPVSVRDDLYLLAADSSRVERSSELSPMVVLAQVRSMIVDALQITGLDDDEALRGLPPPTPSRG